MQIRLAENIRALRRQHRFTQEQLAESLGVTPGAVYKWEAGLSQPELAIIVELADLFDTSVDVLLGYEVKDNRRQTTAERLRRYRTEKDRAGLAEAEKALQKYPNDFEIVYRSAGLYRVFGIVEGDEALLRRALALLDKARLLLPQNADPKIDETVLYAETAQTLLALGEADKAVSLWKTHNAGGFYSHIIGSTLSSSCDRPQDALPFLSDALLTACANLVNIVVGYLNVYYKQQDFAATKAIIRWGLDTFGGLKDADKPCFLDKVNASMLVCLAGAQKNSGELDAAAASLRQARALAAQFDAAPDYRGDALRFVSGGEPAGIYFSTSNHYCEKSEKRLIFTSLHGDVVIFQGVSNVAFLPVAIRTAHFAVFRYRLAALAPRRDVVALHLLIGKVLLAIGANAALPLIRRPLLAFRKGADA